MPPEWLPGAWSALLLEAAFGCSGALFFMAVLGQSAAEPPHANMAVEQSALSMNVGTQSSFWMNWIASFNWDGLNLFQIEVCEASSKN